MEPNFVDGQRLLVNKLAYRWSVPERGDVIVFHAPERPGKDFIKRVIALPGDKVAIKDGQVLVNDEEFTEPWRPIVAAGSFGPYVVPEGHYFVLGDNRPNSNDSRAWSQALPASAVVGEVVLSIWPAELIGPVSASGPGPAASTSER
jgi:signal peptidase I